MTWHLSCTGSIVACRGSCPHVHVGSTVAARGGVRGCARGHAEGSARGAARVDVRGSDRDPRGDAGDGAWDQAGPGARAKVTEHASGAVKRSVWGGARGGQ